MKNLVFKIQINAAKQKVWETMLEPESYKIWSGAGWPGSFYEGNWKEKEKVSFLGEYRSGTVVLIEAYEPYDLISAKHIAVLQKGVEDTESDNAKAWIGTTESYTFKEQINYTELIIDINTNTSNEKIFTDGWPDALKKLKEICEQ